MGTAPTSNAPTEGEEIGYSYALLTGTLGSTTFSHDGVEYTVSRVIQSPAPVATEAPAETTGTATTPAEASPEPTQTSASTPDPTLTSEAMTTAPSKSGGDFHQDREGQRDLHCPRGPTSGRITPQERT